MYFALTERQEVPLEHVQMRKSAEGRSFHEVYRLAYYHFGSTGYTSRAKAALDISHYSRRNALGVTKELLSLGVVKVGVDGHNVISKFFERLASRLAARDRIRSVFPVLLTGWFLRNRMWWGRELFFILRRGECDTTRVKHVHQQYHS